MRNSVFQVFAAALYKTQRLIKSSKVNLGANLYCCAVKFAATASDTLFHKLPACTRIAVSWRCYHPAYAGFGIGNFLRDYTCIGNQFRPIPAAKMHGWLVLIIRILVTQFCSTTKTSFRNCITAYNSAVVSSSNFLKTQFSCIAFLVSSIILNKVKFLCTRLFCFYATSVASHSCTSNHFCTI